VGVGLRGPNILERMCPTMAGVNRSEGFRVVVGGTEQQIGVENVKHKFQVFIFYPSVWDEESASLLSCFSSLVKQFSSTNSCVYGCSTDCIGSNLEMSKTSFGSSLLFPLLSDPAGQLARRFSLFDEEERMNMRGVVIADNQGIALEVISTSMEDKEMAEYTLGLVKQILQHRSRLLDRTCRFEEPKPQASLDEKLEELATYSISVVKQADVSRARSTSRSMARSVSRGRSMGRTSQTYRDQSVVNKMKRTEDRLIRGYF